jgi:hypothetical protein
MTNKLKYWLSLLIIMTFACTCTYGSGWDTASWIFTGGGPAGNTGQDTLSDTANQIITGYVQQINTLSLASDGVAIKVGSGGVDETPNINFGEITPGTPVDKLVLVTDISNNNPMGFSIKLESTKSCKLVRQYYNGTTWVDYANATAANFSDGNAIDYTFATKLMTADASGVSVTYGLYESGTSTTVKNQTELEAMNKDSGGTAKNLSTLSAADATFHTFSHQNVDASLNVQHATIGYRIAWYINFTPSNKLLRGKYNDVIKVTLLDGDAT